MDIQGLSVDKWRERQRTRQTSKTRVAHSRTNSVTASVHYSSTDDSVVIGMPRQFKPAIALACNTLSLLMFVLTKLNHSIATIIIIIVIKCTF